MNTDEMTAGISLERKADLILSIQSLRRKDKCTKYQPLSLVGKLSSLVGKLSFVCKVIPGGRKFLRRLLDFSCKLKRMHHRCRLTTEAFLDLDWWLAFLPTWSGTSYILESNWSNPHQRFCTWMPLALLVGKLVLDSSSLVARSNWKRHCMEGAICHSLCSEHLGSPLA